MHYDHHFRFGVSLVFSGMERRKAHDLNSFLKIPYFWCRLIFVNIDRNVPSYTVDKNK